MLEDVFHFHPLSIEDCVTVSPSPKVEEYSPKEEDQFAPYLFMVIHAVDYSRKDGVFATSELNFFLGKNFLVTYHDVPLRSVHADRGTLPEGHDAHRPRAGPRRAHAAGCHRGELQAGAGGTVAGDRRTGAAGAASIRPRRR